MPFLNSSHRALSHIKSSFFLLDDFSIFEGLEPLVARKSRNYCELPAGPDFLYFRKRHVTSTLYRPHGPRPYFHPVVVHASRLVVRRRRLLEKFWTSEIVRKPPAVTATSPSRVFYGPAILSLRSIHWYPSHLQYA